MNSSKLDFMRICIPTGLTFSTFSSTEIKNLSVTNIITPLSFNALGHPLSGGLYDPLMGPLESGGICGTCSLNYIKCPGHFGCIELPLTVINPIYHKLITTILKISCLNCYRILLPKNTKNLLISQLRLLNEGLVAEAQDLESKYCNLKSQWGESKETINDDYVTSALEKVVNECIELNRGTVRECKGEIEMRNYYIKNALGSMFKGKVCPFCRKGLKSITTIRNKILVPDMKLNVANKFTKKKNKSFETPSSGYIYLAATQCKQYLENIWSNDSDTLSCLLPLVGKTNESNPIDILFMTVVPVTPPNCRPVNYLNGNMIEHPLNFVYKLILEDCLMLRSIIHVMNNQNEEDDDKLFEERKEVVDGIRGATYHDKLQLTWQELQMNVDALLDIDVKRLRKPQGIGIKQIIEKKEGIIRMNMMGKRVNYAARTVITPDPNLNIDEVGVPETFAMKLTFPAPVTMWNINYVRNLVRNGPNKYPGANFIENEDGSIIKLDGNDRAQRNGVAKRLLTPGDCRGIKIVHRHLINGDIVLLNRQPTLHKPSIMAHRARVLKGEKTFRLHYANCKSYNADFDGDEMNLHFPQNEVARSEGYNIVSVCKQYLVPKDGTPLSGLIQDHMVSGVRLTMRGRFFTRNEYMQLVYQAVSFVQNDIITLPPAIIKPCKMWSGKQIISTLLKNITPKDKVGINLISTSKISAKAWEKGPSRRWKAGGTPFTQSNTMTEAEVVIRNGELLCGILDKTHYGSTPYSLVHCIYELYGGETASILLSSLAKLFQAFLQLEGFTLGVEDILVVKDADRERRKIIKEIRKIGNEVASGVVDLQGKSVREAVESAFKKDPTFRAVLDHQYKKSLDSYTNKINQVCLPSGLLAKFPKNNLQLMVQSGAKGSTVNTMQISCLLGQIELEGRRPPLMVSGRSLPSFPPYETSPRAGGFIDGRFMTGIQPQEFFFHCMAGREGLIDTAVKTSRSGYLQRCLVKHLEGLTVNYDMTVRDSDGAVVQYMYGEDGMEVTKCQFLKQNLLPFLAENMKSVYNPEEVQSLKEDSDLDGIKTHKRLVKRWSRHQPAGGTKQWYSPFSLFSLQVDGSGTYKKPEQSTGRTKSTVNACKTWRKMSEDEKNKYTKMLRRAPDPVISRYQANRHFGSITEKLDLLIENYFKQNKNKHEHKELKSMLYQKAMRSLCEPGEPVGLLAAQSVGEPSTQMTLNTFHFAGRGEMNVTLGIPRLREILMTASQNIKTPSVSVPFYEHIASSEKQMNKLRRQLTKITMADVLQTIAVTEKIEISPIKRQVFILKIDFLPHSAYKEDTLVTPKDIIKHVEKKFIKELLHHLLSKSNRIAELIDSEKESGSGRNRENDDDDDVNKGEGNPDEDKGDEKKGRKQVGAVDDGYNSSDDEPENEDDDATTVRRRTRQNEEQQYSDLEDDVDAQEDLGTVNNGIKKEVEDDIDDYENEVESEEQVGGDDDDDESSKPQLDESSSVAGPSTQSHDFSNTLTMDSGQRKESVINSHNNVIDYRYDTERYRWCLVTLGFSLNSGRLDMAGKLKDIAKSSVIHQVPGIKRAFITTESDGTKCLKTDGQNFRELYSLCTKLNLNKLYSNDIHAIGKMYGIEAASKLLVKEIQQVFKVYGITVDVRHLNLISDYMTWSGSYKPLSRKGMEGNTSPLQQMSFESSIAFLKSAVTRHKYDDLCSPSSRLMVGRPIKAGTSSFNLMFKINS